MLPKSNLLSDVVLFFKQQLKDLYKEDEIEIFADYVFEEFCNLSRIDRIVKKDLRISESEVILVCNSIKKLQKNMPIQYVVNKAYFYGLPFYVDSSVLIPRPETEELVSWILESVNIAEDVSVLDIGTGSGCIAVSIAKSLPKSEVFAMDISKKALKVAEKNSRIHNTNIRFINGNTLDLSTMPDRKFDIIVSNPPYIKEVEKLQMLPNVLDYEPEIALYVPDENSLIFYKHIAEYAYHNLKESGILFFEINENLSNEVFKILDSYYFTDIQIKVDFRGKKRMVKGVKNFTNSSYKTF